MAMVPGPMLGLALALRLSRGPRFLPAGGRFPTRCRHCGRSPWLGLGEAGEPPHLPLTARGRPDRLRLVARDDIGQGVQPPGLHV